MLQVQYVPNGRGGFFQIMDDETQGGMFAVCAIAAKTLQDCLDGNATHVESSMMFSDGIDVEEVSMCVPSSPLQLPPDFQLYRHIEVSSGRHSHEYETSALNKII